MWYSGLSMLSILNSFVAKQTHTHTRTQRQRQDWIFASVCFCLWRSNAKSETLELWEAASNREETKRTPRDALDVRWDNRRKCRRWGVVGRIAEREGRKKNRKMGIHEEQRQEKGNGDRTYSNRIVAHERHRAQLYMLDSDLFACIAFLAHFSCVYALCCT